MEMPREEMEMVDAAGAAGFDPWDQIVREGGEEPWDEWNIEETAAESAGVDEKPALSVIAATIKTAAMLSREAGGLGDMPAAESLPRVSPDLFKQGMTVTHPEYGPGKIVALSGSGKNRRATIQFATVGQKKIILAHSAVRPAS